MPDRWAKLGVVGGFVGGAIVAGLVLNSAPYIRLGVSKTFLVGTTFGLAACVEATQSSQLSEASVRRACIDQFHREIDTNVDPTATASLPRLRDGKMGMMVDMENDSSRFVVTYADVRLEKKLTDGSLKTYVGNAFTWVEPGEQASLFVELPSLDDGWENITWCEKEDLEKDCFDAWGFTSLKGLRL